MRKVWIFITKQLRYELSVMHRFQYPRPKSRASSVGTFIISSAYAVTYSDVTLSFSSYVL